MDHDATADKANAADAGNTSFEACSWELIELYDLRKPITQGLKNLTYDEIVAAKEAVLTELERNGHEQFKPRLLLMDNNNKSRLAIIHVIHDKEHIYDGERNRNRTYYIYKGQIIFERIGHAKNAAVQAK